jgi:hypothetical protein
MRRIYTSVANFRAPYNNVEFAGLGDAPAWPKGRTYWDTANFMATQDDGYFQDNSLFGLGLTDAQRANIEAARKASSEMASRAGAAAAKAEAVARGLIPPPSSLTSYLWPVAIGAAIIGAAVAYRKFKS